MHTRDGIWYVCEWTCAWEGASRRIPRRRCVQEGASNTSYHRHVAGVWYGCVRSQSVVRTRVVGVLARCSDRVWCCVDCTSTVIPPCL